MKAKILLTLTPVLISFFACFGQNPKAWKEGFYTTLQGDTVKGYILLGEKEEFSAIKFKAAKEDEKYANISIANCKSIGFKDKNYLVWTGKRSMVALSKFDFDLINIDSFRTETIPLLLLYKGKLASLYLYNDVRDHYFIEKDGKMDELLINYSRIDVLEALTHRTGSVPKYVSTPIYRDQLMYIFKDSMTRKKQNHIAVLLYEYSGMMSIIKLLNK